MMSSGMATRSVIPTKNQHLPPVPAAAAASANNNTFIQLSEKFHNLFHMEYVTYPLSPIFGELPTVRTTAFGVAHGANVFSKAEPTEFGFECLKIKCRLKFSRVKFCRRNRTADSSAGWSMDNISSKPAWGIRHNLFDPTTRYIANSCKVKMQLKQGDLSIKRFRVEQKLTNKEMWYSYSLLVRIVFSCGIE